ncbi:uncharacterized protein PG998_006795 [Apiospora kogelbergensis]|uniref:uncharacterized protein n=1 Tax=Apiospora kogelbergensis TaxID=1337665 RepID=UPI0031307B76
MANIRIVIRRHVARDHPNLLTNEMHEWVHVENPHHHEQASERYAGLVAAAQVATAQVAAVQVTETHGEDQHWALIVAAMLCLVVLLS